jgi:DNA-binding transcriptional regulator YiaG
MPSIAPEAHRQSEMDRTVPALFSPPNTAARDDDQVTMWWSGDKLRSAMRERGLTQSVLAGILGVSQPTVSEWVNGATPSQAYVISIAQVLEFDDFRVLFVRDGMAAILSGALGDYVAGRERDGGRS